MKKLLLLIGLLLPTLCFSQKRGNAPKTYDLVVGAYTRPGGNKGITVYRFYPQDGRLTFLNKIDSLENPTYLAVTADHKFVYAGSESKTGEVSALKFDVVTGKLTLINKQSSGGPSTVHVNVDKRRKNVFVTNYSGGNISVLPINQDGSLSAASQIIKYAGSGTNKARQESPHIHSSILSKDEKYLLDADLGTDKIHIYKYNPSAEQPLTPAEPAFEMVQGGNGPRHMVFSDNGKYLYLVQEMGASVNAYSYNKGKLTFLQSVNLNAEGFTGRASGGDIHLSPDGNYLYASNRGTANEVVQYAINKDSGQLLFVDRASVGKTPRSFIIEPAGNFMIVSCQDGNVITVHKIDKATGKLTATDVKIDIATPVALQLVPAEY